MTKIVQNRYRVGKQLNTGAFGKVYLSIDNQDNSKKAIKRLELDDYAVAVNEVNIAQEAAVLTSLSHESIIKHYDLYYDQEYLWITMEYFEKGSLDDFMKEQQKKQIRKSEERLLMKWLKQCASALNYLHARSIMHRHINLLNIFLTNENNAKLGDFGISLTLDGTHEATSSRGKLLYNSPELYKENKYSYESDIWSLGIAFYELAIYELPFKNVLDILNKEFVDLPENFTRHYNLLIKQMLVKDPDERIDSNGILNFFEEIDMFPNRYEVGKLLYTGAFGKVYLSIDKKDNSKKAIKRLELDDFGVAINEINIAQKATALASFSHDNIIKYFDLYQYQEYFWITMEYCEKGSLYDFMKEQQKKQIRNSEERLLMKWLIQCASALNYLHARIITHRDINLLNIFLTNDDNVKLGDFEISLTLDGIYEATSSRGKLLYNSPELYKENKYSYESDIWSLGVSFYELAIYELPFKSVDDILNKEFVDLPEYFTRHWNLLIKQMLMKDPNERIDSNVILKILEMPNDPERIQEKYTEENNKKFSNDDPNALKEDIKPNEQDNPKPDFITPVEIIPRIKAQSEKFESSVVLKRMALFKNGTIILKTDSTWKGLYVWDLKENSKISIGPYDCLKKPWALSVGIKKNGYEEIYIHDKARHTVFVFNSNFEVYKTIGKDLIKSVDYITFDNDVLYCSHTVEDAVRLWDVNTGEKIRNLKIEQPNHIRLSEREIYILSRTDCHYPNKKLVKLTKGNYINVLSRSNFEIMHKIQFDDWLFPHSLHLSNDSNIYTTAHQLDANGFYSKNRFLFVIDSKNHTVKQKVELEGIDTFNDALYLKNKMILCAVNGKGNQISTIEFEGIYGIYF